MPSIVIRATALFSIVILSACASSTDMIDDKSVDCAGRSDLEIRVGLNSPGVAMENSEDSLTLSVEVSNNARRDVVVKSVRVEQGSLELAPYVFDNAYRRFNQTIPENEDYTFELPTNGRSTLSAMNRRGRMSSESLLLLVSVTLEDGVTYRCRYSAPAPR